MAKDRSKKLLTRFGLLFLGLLAVWPVTSIASEATVAQPLLQEVGQAPKLVKPRLPSSENKERTAQLDANETATGLATFVAPPESPTTVKLGMYLIGLVEVSAPNDPFPTFKAEMFVDAKWHDARLAFDAKEVGLDREVFLEHEAELKLETIWSPDIEFENEQGERHVESRELVVEENGEVEYSERFQAVFSVDMDMRKFPFDHQNLSIHAESFSWDSRYVVFQPMAEKTGFNEDFKTLEWLLHDVHTEVHEKKEVRSANTFSEYIYSINVDRDPGFYLYKIVIPLLLIVAFNWVTFWMPGEPASVRLERGVIALLTVVAFHQVVAANLPRIGYLTFMDGIVYIAFGSVGLTMIATIWAQRQEYLGKPERIAKM
ncbi:MAG: hypothetical protein MK135_13245, partial [Polyangiaceae bacterium]|nr:hypothetical protein [Polyangiaceae bacterium]